jgi:hypothetical protein
MAHLPLSKSMPHGITVSEIERLLELDPISLALWLNSKYSPDGNSTPATETLLEFGTLLSH